MKKAINKNKQKLYLLAKDGQLSISDEEKNDQIRKRRSKKNGSTAVGRKR